MLSPEQDAFGQAMMAYWTEEAGQEIIERSDGYFDHSSGPAVYFTTYDRWPAHYKAALKFARGKILDIGCGAGRIALHLQKQGHEVTGIDNSPLAIEVCQQRGLKNAEVRSITDLSWRFGFFDSLVMLGNNFGLFSNHHRARWLLRRFRKMTTPAGVIIAESNDPYQTENPHHLAYHAENRARGRMSGQIRLRVRYQKYKTPWFDYLIVSQAEMTEILAGTGWRVERFIESQGSTYIAVIVKTGTPGTDR